MVEVDEDRAVQKGLKRAAKRRPPRYAKDF